MEESVNNMVLNRILGNEDLIFHCDYCPLTASLERQVMPVFELEVMEELENHISTKREDTIRVNTRVKQQHAFYLLGFFTKPVR